MAWKRRTFGGIVAFVGYMLSPLSWWNDMFVNFPLALAFAWGISLFYRPAFGPAVVLGYWLTNVAGFILLHKGTQEALSKRPQKYSRRELLKDIAISLAYTVLILILLKLKILKPIQNYFNRP